MGYPEEQITFCRYCREEIPPAYFWRGGGFVLTNGGREMRTVILRSLCPTCGEEQCSGLQGWLPYRLFYAWLWALRYPALTRPHAPFAWVRVDEETMPEAAARRTVERRARRAA